MTRISLRGLALPLAVAGAAAAASPALADTTVLDTSFGTNGFAFSDFGPHSDVYSPVTIAGPGGSYITGAVSRTNVSSLAGDQGLVQGVAVLFHDAQGTETDRLTFPDLPTLEGRVFDLRRLEDGTLVVAGAGKVFDENAEGQGQAAWVPASWTIWIPPTGKPVTQQHTLPYYCSNVRDAAILPDGRVAFAYSCDGAPDGINIVDPHPAPAPTTRAAVADEHVNPPVWADRLAVDAQGRLLALENVEGTDLTRLIVGQGDQFDIDQTFGDQGSVPVPAQSDELAVDGDSRPLVGFDKDGIAVLRFRQNGAADDDFGDHGRANYVDERADGMEQLAADDQDRVLFGATLVGKPGARGIVRLLDNGAPDGTFGANGMQELDQDRVIRFNSPPLGLGGSTVVSLSFYDYDRVVATERSTAVPAPQSRGTVALLRFADPKPPVTQPQDQPTITTPASPAATQAASRSAPKTLRTCLSRRSFTIRVRPKHRKLVSATVRVAGKKVKVRRKNGRLTATVNLAKLKQATFTVSVVARDAKRRTYRDTRTYRTCRVGENGRKVQGGSTIITVGS